ncbi:MAG: hypothetical protein MJ108_08015 [Saccharofermentans sp.]|nr:hypothetical protein [Saccharofermentans sp.]
MSYDEMMDKLEKIVPVDLERSPENVIRYIETLQEMSQEEHAEMNELFMENVCYMWKIEELNQELKRRGA